MSRGQDELFLALKQTPNLKLHQYQAHSLELEPQAGVGQLVGWLWQLGAREMELQEFSRINEDVRPRRKSAARINGMHLDKL
jgi:hypothetical protein